MKQKLFTFFLALLTGAGTLFAYDVQVSGLYYNINSTTKKATVTYKSYVDWSYNKDVYGKYWDIKTATIPSEIYYNGSWYTVTKIESRAFANCSGLTSITIPNSVTSIGQNAFLGCNITNVTWNAKNCVDNGGFGSNVESFTFGNEVESIPAYCCNGMNKLISIVIPNSVTSIGEGAFSDCTSLTSINVDNNNPNYSSADGVLFNKDKTMLIQYPAGKIGAYIIPNTVEDIGWKAFYGCSELTSLSIGNSVASIGNEAFKNCTNLKKITLNSGEIVGKNYTDFSDNMSYIFGSQVEEYIIGNNVTSIGDNAFVYCAGLRSITIPNSVTSIGNVAFAICTSLTTVSIPNSVISIGDWTFSGCTGLTSITIPNSVTDIGEGAFSGCTGLTSIIVDNNNRNYCSIDGVLFNKDKTMLIQYPAGKIGAYIIPDNVTNIGLSAFGDCAGLSSITIPNSVTSIEYSAFSYCSGLRSITIPNSVTSIGYSAFMGCSNLTSVTIGNSVMSMGDWTFCGCSSLNLVEWNAKQCTIQSSLFYDYDDKNDIRKNITSLIIGAEVRSLPDNLFEGLSNLKTITSYAETPPLLGQDVFKNAYSKPTIYVPCNMKASYQAEWTQFAASCYQYAPANYLLSLRANDYAAGSVSKVSTGNACEGHVFKATANTGYHFVQWTDGVSDNPRTVLLTQDTTFTAEFAKDVYTIHVQANDTRMGTVSDDITAYYQDEVTLTATANYGYHFEYWEKSDNRHYYSNPYTFTVMGSDVYTANFAKNTYYLNYYYDSSKGSVSGSNSGEYLDEITIQAEPNYGYHFVQWSDGVKDNPRTIELTQDTTFRAEFAVDRAGQCGTNMQLTWVYDPSNKTLTISGNGSLEYNYTYGVEAPSDMRELIIGNGVTIIGEDAFKDAETLVELSLGENVKTIKDNAFKGCLNLRKIYNYRTTPTNAYSFAFDEHLDKFDCELYVLAGSLEMYKMANVWKDFYYIKPIGTTETTVTEDKVTVSPADNTALFTWRMSEDASTYTLQITKDGVIFCTLVFGADGSLKGIAFAPGKDGQAHAPAATLTANGMQFTVTGLDAASKYAYRLAVADAQNNEIIAYSGEFATNGYEGEVNPGGNPEGIDEVPSDQVQSTKILRDGQIFILRGNKTYTVTGQEVR